MSEEKTVQDKAIIYSTPTCQFCKNVEAYLDEKGYKFEKIDVSGGKVDFFCERHIHEVEVENG